ncbi:hypothetical protein ACP275_12G030800 [Erythranthe tilingii]
MEHKHLILCFVALILLAIYFPCFLCQCDGEPFDCGNVRYISYPFWGGARPQSCGRGPGYKLICDNGLPKLNISSLTYVVQKINFDDKTLKIAREDLLTNTCPTIIRDTTIDRNLFEYTSESQENNVTLYYGCSDKNGETGYLESKPNRFSCDGGGVNLFDESSEGPGPNITCGESITVPVSKDYAQSLENPTSSSINILQSALASGFSVRWLSNGKERDITYCSLRVYSTCFSPTNGTVYTRRPCARTSSCGRDGGGVYKPAPAHQVRQGRMPPESTQAPAYSPESDDNSPRTGHGLPPNLSPIAAVYYPGNDGSYNHDKHGRRNHVTEIIIAVVVLLSISGVIIVFIATKLCLKRRRPPTGPNQKSNQEVESILLQHGLLAPKRYKYSEIKKITKSFNEKLGQGGYGSVYKGVLPDGTIVAVKVLIETDSNGEEFVNEVASISRTSHVNIVNLLGFSFDRNKRALMYEFMPNKSLDKFINNNNCQDCSF